MMKKFFLAISIVLLVVFNIRMCSQLLFSGEKQDAHEPDSLNTCVDYAHTSSLIEQDVLNTHIDYVNTSGLIEQDFLDTSVDYASTNSLSEQNTVDSLVDYTVTSSSVEQTEPLETLIAVNDLGPPVVMNEERQFCRVEPEGKRQKFAKITRTKGEIAVVYQDFHAQTEPESFQQQVDTQVQVPFAKVKEQRKAMKSKKELDALLAQLSRRSDFGEFGMQAVLNLLSLEIALVDHLLDDSGAYALERLVKKREKALHKSMLSVARVHDMILDEATFNAYLEAKLQKYARKNEARLWRALTRFEKKAFLDYMKDTLIHYFNVIRNTQHERYSA